MHRTRYERCGRITRTSLTAPQHVQNDMSDVAHSADIAHRGAARWGRARELLGDFEDADGEHSWATDLACAPGDFASHLEIGESFHELFDRDPEFEPSKV